MKVCDMCRPNGTIEIATSCHVTAVPSSEGNEGHVSVTSDVVFESGLDPIEGGNTLHEEFTARASRDSTSHN